MNTALGADRLNKTAATGCEHGGTWVVDTKTRRVVRRPCERCLERRMKANQAGNKG